MKQRRGDKLMEDLIRLAGAVAGIVFLIGLAVLLTACGTVADKLKLERPPTYETQLAYAQGQCTQVRVDALKLAAAGQIGWGTASAAQEAANRCRSAIEWARRSDADVLECILPGSDKPADCPARVQVSLMNISKLMLEASEALNAYATK